MNEKRSNYMKKISIVVPCYNEEESLPLFYKAVDKITDKMKKKATFEFVFVNDGSRDKTLEILRDLAKKDNRVRYISCLLYTSPSPRDCS